MQINLTINDLPVSVEAGSTILEAASKLDIRIPTLCHIKLDCLHIEHSTGSCRICVVEVEGRPNLAPACCTPVAEGMKVKTNTLRVINARRVILDLLLSRPHRFGMFYNVNFPDVPSGGIKGVKVCHMGRAHWEREYRDFREFLAQCGREPSQEDLRYLEAAEPGEEIFVMAGDFTDNGDSLNFPDHIFLADGWITVTPHNIDNTDCAEEKALSEIFV